MNEEQLFEIAKIIDNEFRGKDKTFTAKKIGIVWHLNTNVCDYASLIRVSEISNKILSIQRLCDDTDGWQDIQPQTWQRISQYLNSLNKTSNSNGKR